MKSVGWRSNVSSRTCAARLCIVVFVGLVWPSLSVGQTPGDDATFDQAMTAFEKQNYAESFRVLSRVEATTRDERILHALGHHYQTGTGTTRNVKRSIVLYRRAVESNQESKAYVRLMAALLTDNDFLLNDEICGMSRKALRLLKDMNDEPFLAPLLNRIGKCVYLGLGEGPPFDTEAAAAIFSEVLKLTNNATKEWEREARIVALDALRMVHSEPFPSTFDLAKVKAVVDELKRAERLAANGKTHNFVVPADPRIPLDLAKKENAQFRGVGIVHGPIDLVRPLVSGTGFLIDSCHVVTNAHVIMQERFSDVVHGRTKYEAKKGFEYVFYLGQDAAPVRRPRLAVTAKVIWDGIADKKDIALLRLARNAPVEYVALRGLWQEDELLGIKNVAFHIGYPVLSNAKRREGIGPWLADRCAQHGDTSFAGDLWMFSCVSTPGNSGGPVFVTGKDGRPLVLGVVTGGNDWKENSFQGAGVVPLFQVGEKIRQAVANDPC